MKKQLLAAGALCMGITAAAETIDIKTGERCWIL